MAVDYICEEPTMFPWIFFWAPQYNFRPRVDSSHEALFAVYELQKTVVEAKQQIKESTNQLMALQTVLNTKMAQLEAFKVN
jgi:hypothetical protein